MAKLVWRVKLIAELEPAIVSATEVARIERDNFAVNEIVSRRMIKKQQMRWNRWTVQPFLDVRATVLNGTLEGAFRRRYPDFRPTSGHIETPAAA